MAFFVIEMLAKNMTCKRTQIKMQSTEERPEASVRERRHDQAARVAQVLVAVHQLRVDHARRYLHALVFLLFL